MKPIRISHPQIYPFQDFSGPGAGEIEDGNVKSWASEASEVPGLVACLGSFTEEVFFNQIVLEKHPEFKSAFPDNFRFEISQDGQIWEPILRESDFRHEGKETMTWNFPLISARYIKFLFIRDKKFDEGYMSAFGAFRVMVSGIVDIKVSGELDRLWVKDNLIDQRNDYGWSSPLRSRQEEEFIRLDLGSVNRVSEIRLLSRNVEDTLFPEGFHISYSEDNISWHHLMEESGFLAEPGQWYRWRFLPLNIRFIQITVFESARTREGKYLSQIIELELFASADPVEKQDRTLPAEPIPHASVLRSGIVRLGLDGEARDGVVVQGSDRRLRDATSDFKGIVELASDGEDREGVVVQGSDRRLKPASEDLAGIVRLARNGEERGLHAVQADDDRLKPATGERSGLVELADDGEDRAGVVVQGSDSRLKYATEKASGIVRLAPAGGSKPSEVVQGSDPRLRDATTETKGILRFARAGEVEPETAVQGSDPRLRLASVETPGIVELASNGEARDGVAVQGSDARLKAASADHAGIVKLAPEGAVLSGHVIQSTDPRLSDARKPLAHEHDYAPVQHDYSSHTGTIRVESSMGKLYNSVSPPPVEHAPVQGVNKGEGAGLTGRSEGDGVIGYGEKSGLLGLSRSGEAVRGVAGSGPGGRFLSESFYSIVAGGHDDREVPASDLGLWVRGLSRFSGTIFAGKSGESLQAPVAAFMPVRQNEVLGPGDVLVATDEEGVLARCSQRGSRQVIGIIVEKAAIVLNPPVDYLPEQHNRSGLQKPEGMELVAFFGVVQLRVSAEGGKIVPGDSLVASYQPGCCEKAGEKDSALSIVGKSLGFHEKGDGLVTALVTVR